MPPVAPEEGETEGHEGNLDEGKQKGAVMKQVFHEDVDLLHQPQPRPGQGEKQIQQIHDDDGYDDSIEPSDLLRGSQGDGLSRHG